MIQTLLKNLLHNIPQAFNRSVLASKKKKTFKCKPSAYGLHICGIFTDFYKVNGRITFMLLIIFQD